MSITTTRNAINSTVKTNGKGDITASALNAVLNAMLDEAINYEGISYSNLVTKISVNGLEIGKKYLITDYTTVYKQPETGNIVTEPVIEFLVVTALSNSALEPIAYSMDYPNDIIYYDINNDTTKYEWADPTNGKGVIYRRIDANNNDLPYDHTKIKFRRWSIDYDSITQWTSGETCNFGDIRRNSGTANNNVYLCIRNNITENPTTSNSVNWLLFLANAAGTNKMYWLNNASGEVYLNIDTSFGYLEYLYLPVGDSIDCYTFHNLQNNANGNLYNNVRDNVIDNYVSLGIKKLGNNVFMGYGTSIGFNYNTVGNYFGSNTVLDNVNSNWAGKDLTSYAYLYNKDYSATIQQSGNYNYIVTYYDDTNTLITNII
jgi:hypothetical protein